MKLVIAGKNSIAVDVLKYALQLKTIDIFVVLNKTENFLNGFQKSLGFYSKLWNVKTIQLEDVYSLEDAVFLSLEFDRIIKPNLFKTKKLYNIHFSLLPSYKGMYTSALPILHGEKYTGVTLHEIDKGIDTGDIILQKKIRIRKNDTARSLYEKYTETGTKLVVNNLIDLIDNKLDAHQQSSKNATYYGKKSIDYATLKINYNQTAAQVCRQIRAFTFREYQLPKFKENELIRCKIRNEKSILKAGQVVTETNFTIQVATIDYDILLTKDIYSVLWAYCKLNKHKELKKLLTTTSNILLETKTKEGWTALIIAAYHGAYECVKILISFGANVNAHNYNHTNVLMYAKTNAIKTNNKQILEVLLANNANLTQKDIYNKTLLDWTKEESIELYTFLKDK